MQIIRSEVRREILPPSVAEVLPQKLTNAVGRLSPAEIPEELRLHAERIATVTCAGRDIPTGVTLTREDMRDYHFIKGDAEGLVNEPLRIKGLKLSISLREDDRVDNQVWVSLRSVDDFPCNEVAQRFFNGGGHLNASGGRLNCSIEEAENVAREAFRCYAERLKA